MKMQIFFLAIVSLLFMLSCGTTPHTPTQPNTRYFNEQGEEVSKGRFKRDLDYGKYLDVQKENGLHLVKRLNKGTISSTILDQIMTAFGINEMGSKELLVINYHPGKDRCNSTGTSDKNWLKNKYDNYQYKVKNELNSTLIHVYKSKEGLKRYQGIINFIPDQNQLIERNFFKYHYPCNSFVVIDKKGNYVSWFGEYHYDHVIKLGQELINSNS